MVNRTRVLDVAQELQAYRLSILAEIESQRSALDDLRAVLTRFEQEHGSPPELIRPIRQRGSEVLTSSEAVAKLLVGVEDCLQDLQGLLGTRADA